jgi:chemotaxis protein histidine kinase CheA
MDLSEFLPDFLTQARLVLDQMEQILTMILEGDPPPAAERSLLADPVDPLYRTAHSLKGTVSFFFRPPMTGLATGMEALLYRMQQRQAAGTIEESTARLLLEGVEGMRAMLAAVACGDEPQALPELEQRLANL